MSHLTDAARARASAGQPRLADAADAADTPRRGLLRGALAAGLVAPWAGGLALLGAGPATAGDATAGDAPTPGFTPVPMHREDRVSVPEGHRVAVLCSAGDALLPGAGTPEDGRPPTLAQALARLGGNHDGMQLHPLPGVDPDRGGLLALNHEYPDLAVLGLPADFDGHRASRAERALALSAVGVSLLEVARTPGGPWRVVPGSRHHRRHTGLDDYAPHGPAAAALGPALRGTLNNCASGDTPWGHYLSCEESPLNYLDPDQPAEAYGWVLEIDPLGRRPPVKRTALGRFAHENVACAVDADGHLAFYMGEDAAPGSVFKFVPHGRWRPGQAAGDLLDHGTLYAARFEADGRGVWLPLRPGASGLGRGVTDPGTFTQGGRALPPRRLDLQHEADILLQAAAAARVAGATPMDRPEWLTVGRDGAVYASLSNHPGRMQTDAANPRAANRDGHLIRWTEDGGSPRATRFRWSLLGLAGGLAAEDGDGGAPRLGGDAFSSPDGLRMDPAGRLWVQTDHAQDARALARFGHNALLQLDPQHGTAHRFLVGPKGCEITGLTWTPDMRNFFVNIQHPSGRWPSRLDGSARPARSSTVTVWRPDGGRVGG